MKYRLLHYPVREFQIWNLKEQALAFILTLVAFVILGPFETYALPFAHRITFWFVSLLAGWSFVIGAMTLVMRHPALDDWPGTYRMALAICIAVVPTSYAVWNIEELLRPERESTSLLLILLNVAFVCSLIGWVMYLRVRSRLGTINSPQKVGQSSFLDRLPIELGTNIVSLTTRDHYVEVTTNKGSDLILMRFSDAIDELLPIRGIQIHRSHWIAAQGFRKLKREKGKLVAELTDGRTLPVSRTYAESARAFFGRR